MTLDDIRFNIWWVLLPLYFLGYMFVYLKNKIQYISIGLAFIAMFMFVVCSVAYGKLQKGNSETDDDFNKRKIKEVEKINPYYYIIISLLFVSAIIFWLCSKYL